MGMSRKYINFINNSVKVNFENKKRLTGLSMVELGDQVINDPSILAQEILNTSQLI